MNRRRSLDTQGAAAEPLEFVGRLVCAECHEREAELWQGSHHDLAMQVADEETVLGDFDDAAFTHFGVTSTFFKRDGKFFVRTEGSDGELHDYEIAHTFGAFPLQQYLIAFPGGRYQALGIAWDARPVESGGQRWFHLYPDARIEPGDPLHWTGIDQTWNHMCAECHSTNLAKNYRSEEDRYETAWSEIDVSCEACHGPGSEHVIRARSAGARSTSEPYVGLPAPLAERKGATWTIDPATGIAGRSPPLTSRAEVEACARCHARRAALSSEYEHGRPLIETHRPAFLEPPLYHADGQIDGEVYVYGSFLQSKMYRAGVSCSDCHDPHSLELRRKGNGVCTGCHLTEKYDTPSHHFHAPGSPGASCVECHMPARTYMVVDPRRDHSLRVPRPDLSVKLGTPNACNGCHTERSARWAAGAVAGWHGAPERAPHYGEALDAGRNGRAGAESQLVRLAGDTAQPAIARASALGLLRRYPGPSLERAVTQAIADPEPLIRLGALTALESVEPVMRLSMAYLLLRDPVLIVRLEAARALATVPPRLMTVEQRSALDLALAEYREAQTVNADRPESHMNLALLGLRLGRFGEAERAYRTALRIDTSFTPAYINLADLYRAQGRDPEGERILRDALKRGSDDGDLHHALGLALVRQQRLEEALVALGRAAELRPDLPRYSYVLGVALYDAGQVERALKVLRTALDRHPYDRELLLGMVTFSREAGSLEVAIEYARRLAELSPGDPAVRELVQQLEAARR